MNEYYFESVVVKGSIEVELLVKNANDENYSCKILLTPDIVTGLEQIIKRSFNNEQ